MNFSFQRRAETQGLVQSLAALSLHGEYCYINQCCVVLLRAGATEPDLLSASGVRSVELHPVEDTASDMPQERLTVPHWVAKSLHSPPLIPLDLEHLFPLSPLHHSSIRPSVHASIHQCSP